MEEVKNDIGITPFLVSISDYTVSFLKSCNTYKNDMSEIYSKQLLSKKINSQLRRF